MTQAQTRTTYRLNRLTLDGQLSEKKDEFGPDCLTVQAAKATKIKYGAPEGRQLAIEATSWRLGGDGMWRETGSVIAEVL